jgi:hypothetical protein
MGVKPPPVDPRDFDRLVEDTKKAILAALADPEPPEQCPGEGLVRVFARLAEIVVERLNRVPEKNLLAFLAMLGLDQQPPQPARVPLTFELAKGATRGRVPAGTASAAIAAEGEDASPAYETERELVLTSTRLVAAFTREPARDRYRDAGAVLARSPITMPVFEGDQPVVHELYIGDPLLALPQLKQVTLSIAPTNLPDVSSPVAWPLALSWSAFDREAWKPIPPPVVREGAGAWQVSFPDLAGIAPSSIADTTQPWLRARLDTSLPRTSADRPHVLRRSDLPPDAAAAGDRLLDPDESLAPFAGGAQHRAFSVACDEAFTKPDAWVTVSVEVDPSVTAAMSDDLVLMWFTSNGSGSRTLGTSSGDTAQGTEPDEQGFSDTTHAFTHDGQIVFRAPRDWVASVIAGVRAHWLQVVVTGRQFTTLPLLRRVAVSYEWPQPWVTKLEREVNIAADGRAPDALHFDDTPLDASKDFLPFGKEPAFNDVFYVACDEALSLPDNEITLRITGTRKVSRRPAQPRSGEPPPVTWEVYDAGSGSWLDVEADDQTHAFTFAGDGPMTREVRFRTPGVPGAVELGGVPRFCVRARLTSGDYGGPATVVSDLDADKHHVLKTTPASWDPPSIKSIEIDYGFTAIPAPPEALATVNDFEPTVPTRGEFFPFTFTKDQRPTLYLGADDDFDNSTTMLFLDAPAAPARAGRSVLPSESAVVSWEYRNEAGWQPLGARDETRGFGGRGLLTFVAPADMISSKEFGIEAYWLRARWERGEYLAPPWLSHVLANTTWARHVATVRDELLGSATGEERQTFRTARAPILAGEQIDVRELDTPSGAELAVILAEEGDNAVQPLAAEPGRPSESWVRWHSVVDFYASGPRSRHYVLDRLTGEVRFGDGRRGMAPPQGRGNVRATLYTTGGGEIGNRPAGAITQLKTAVPSVAAVVNVAAATGGADAEPLEAVRDRGPRLLRHGNRAVTIGDVEDLARDASPAVARVLGVPATNSSDAGSVGVVVVPSSGARQPLPSIELLERVRVYVEQRLPLNARVWVAGPGWARIDVTAEVVAISPEQAGDVSTAIYDTLERFLHPLTGGPQGGSWAFGRSPRRSDVLAVIEEIPGVDHVRGLAVATTQTSREPSPGATLVYSGDHRIAMASSTDDVAG